MKKLVLLGAGLMLVLATTANAGLEAQWNNCVGTGGAQVPPVFDCAGDGSAIYSLQCSMAPLAPITGFIAAQGIVDMTFPGGTIPDFYQFSASGCNNSGIDMPYNRPAAATCGALNTICSTALSTCSGSGVAGYGTGPSPTIGPANRGRFILALARPTAINLTTSRYFVWSLNFSLANIPGAGGADCAGCAVPFAITWDWVDLYNNSANTGGEALALSMDATSPGSQASQVANGATAQDIVPVHNKTWGQLKSLYR